MPNKGWFFTQTILLKIWKCLSRRKKKLWIYWYFKNENTVFKFTLCRILIKKSSTESIQHRRHIPLTCAFQIKRENEVCGFQNNISAAKQRIKHTSYKKQTIENGTIIRMLSAHSAQEFIVKQKNIRTEAILRYPTEQTPTRHLLQVSSDSKTFQNQFLEAFTGSLVAKDVSHEQGRGNLHSEGFWFGQTCTQICAQSCTWNISKTLKPGVKKIARNLQWVKKIGF